MLAKTDIHDWVYLIVGMAIAVIILASGLAIALRYALTGGKLKLKVGGMETSVDTTRVLEKMQEIHDDTKAINAAVNHQSEGEPPLIARVVSLGEQFQVHQERFDQYAKETNRHLCELSKETKGLKQGQADISVVAVSVAARLEGHIGREVPEHKETRVT